MTEADEQKLRSLAANEVDLQVRIAHLRAALGETVRLEDIQALRGDMYVAEARLHEVQHQVTLLKMGMGYLLNGKT